jgi:hypothetical protein
MSTPADNETAADPGRLRELPDPEFIAVWASLRGQLARTPAGHPGHPEIKNRYDAAKAEYRRRLDGGLLTGRSPQPVSHATTPGSREEAAVTAAAAARRQCICQEDPGNGPCGHPAPLTREQVGRLRAYAAQHPERAVILSELAGEWMSALVEFLPPGADADARVIAWMSDPYDLPDAAGLRASTDLETLLDLLGAPSAAETS